MNNLILLALILTACGSPDDPDKDGIAPRLVAFNVTDETDDYTGDSIIGVDGRISTETTGQRIAYEISASISKEEPGDDLDCTDGDQVRIFYRETKFDAEPETTYFLVGCALNKETGETSVPELRTITTKKVKKPF